MEKELKTEKTTKKVSKKKIKVEEEILLDETYKCIISIVSRGYARDAVRASREAGARGAIILQGRGIGQSERKFFGSDIEPENEVVISLVEESIAISVIKAVYAAVDYKGPGRGLVFAVPVSYVSGMINAKELFEN